MSKQGVVTEIHKSARRNFPTRPVTLKGLHDLLQADLVDVSKYKTYNDNHTFILMVINAFSKKAYAAPLKNKSGPVVTQAFRKILQNIGFKGFNLQTDKGLEFYNQQFQKLMKEYGINHYSTYSDKKASIVERLNRTILSWLFKEFSLQGSYRWIDILPKIIDKYNNTKHRTIKLAPNEVNSKKIETNLLKSVFKYKRPYKRQSLLQVGDLVRLNKNKKMFEKGYLPNWSTELFKISAVQPTTPITYKLTDLTGSNILGSFYKEEVQKTSYPDTYLIEKVLKSKNGKKYVKWLGINEKSWIPEEDVLD